MSNINTKTVFPNPLSPNKEKAKKEFGVKVMKAILGANSAYMEKRNSKVREWRMFAQGKQTVDRYMNLLTDDGKTLWRNISYKPRPIVKKFEQIVVQGAMQVEEYPKVTSLAKHINDRKVRKKAEAEYRMEEAETIEIMSQELGIPLEDPNAFTPETHEENDLFHEINDQEMEEILLQAMVTNQAVESDIESIKKWCLTELFQTSFFGLYTYIDRNGKSQTDKIKIENAIYPTSDEEFITRDAHYAGQIKYMTISDIRARWSIDGIEDEKKLWKMANACYNKYGNSSSSYFTWDDRYRGPGDRPYDSTIVPVAHIWWRCNDVVGFVEGYDRKGRFKFDTTDTFIEEGEKSYGKKKGGTVYPQTAYEGYFTMHEEPLCLEWGKAPNNRREETTGKVECPFIYYMADNTGDMDSESPVGSIIDSIEMMDLSILNIKAILAEAAPPGMSVDIDALESINLGEGVGEVSPLTLKSIYKNTGWAYYRGTAASGERQYQRPIEPINNDVSRHIQAYVDVYNFELNNIRDTLGVNELRDGSKTDPRIGFRFAQASMEASNMATANMYRLWLKGGATLIRHWGTLIWYALAYGDPNQGYLAYLGRKNTDWIKANKDIVKSLYAYEYKVGMDAAEKELLENNITAAITAGTLELPDVVAIRDIKDYKLANRYLSYLYNRRKQAQKEDSEELSKISAQANAEAGQAVEQAKQETYRVQIEGERAKEQQRKDSDIAIQTTKSGFEILREALKTGAQLTPEAQMLVQAAFEVAGIKVAKEIDTTRREMESRQSGDVEQELARAVESGQITEEEAMDLAQQQGL